MGSSWPIIAVTSEDRFSSLWDRCPGCHISFLFAVTKLLDKKQLEGFSLCTVWGCQSHHVEEDMAAGRESVGREREAGWSHCIFSSESESEQEMGQAVQAQSPPLPIHFQEGCVLCVLCVRSQQPSHMVPPAEDRAFKHVSTLEMFTSLSRWRSLVHPPHSNSWLSPADLPENDTQFCDLARFLGCKFL